MKNTKFVASITEINKDTDVLVEDVISMGTEGIMYFVNEAIDRKDNDEVFVVADDITMAENTAAVLNAQYAKEMELMGDANMNQEVEVKEEATAETNTSTALRSKAGAKKFLKDQAAKIMSSKKSTVKEETTEEETTMEKKTTMGGRRRLNSSAAVKSEETVVENQTNKEEVVNVEKKNNGRRRMSSANVAGEVKAKAPVNGRKRLGRTGSIKSEFKKFEGPWYLNAEMYPAISRLADVLDNMAAGEYVDAELGIENIVLVEPTDIRRYENRADVVVVIQVKSNGTVLEFPIKESFSNSKSDLSSTSIGWVEYGGKVTPQFGFWKGNHPVVTATCSCGNEIKNASANNVYCYKCRTRMQDLNVTVSTDEVLLTFDEVTDLMINNGIGDYDGPLTKSDAEKLGKLIEKAHTAKQAETRKQKNKGPVVSEFKMEEVVFQTIPNLFVPKDTLALVMAIAQYDAGLDMWGTVEEDAE